MRRFVLTVLIGIGLIGNASALTLQDEAEALEVRRYTIDGIKIVRFYSMMTKPHTTRVTYEDGLDCVSTYHNHVVCNWADVKLKNR